MSEHTTRTILPMLTKTNFKDWKGDVFAYSATATAEQKEAWLEKKISAADEAHFLWKLLCDHCEAKTVQNQSKVYQNFLKIPFKSSLARYLVACEIGISNMRVVGMTIAVPKVNKPTFNENHLAEIIMSKIPSTEELIVKTKTAYKAKTTPTMYCKNSVHNPKTRHSKDKCYQLHPELEPELYKQKRKAKKAVVESTQPDNTESIESQHSVYLARTKALLSSKGTQSWTVVVLTTFEIANGKTVPIVGSGIVGLKNVHGIVFQLKAVHVPDLVHPLISWGRLWDKQCDFICKARGEFEVVDNVT
ncbi:uncharacterized protein VP01_2540g6 [Puccinia sorghi]|uniref:Uncharacterized protein n=1 Tax=Puccinia sorghi TaxID=27349 RepID=A0A0L6V5B1_9BASI|nr:uncharacterized protein VP01_2540g6 [Puccinia sorghi]